MCILKTGISNDIRILSNLNQEVQFRFWMPINSTDLSLSHCVLRAGLWALPGMWNKCMAAYPTSRDGLSHAKLWHLCISSAFGGFPDSSVGIESTCNAGDASSILGSGRSPGEGKGYPLQYSGLENTTDCVRGVCVCPWGRKVSDTTERLSLSLCVLRCLHHHSSRREVVKYEPAGPGCKSSFLPPSVQELIWSSSTATGRKFLYSDYLGFYNHFQMNIYV